jgi:hypothetical protein
MQVASSGDADEYECGKPVLIGYLHVHVVYVLDLVLLLLTTFFSGKDGSCSQK